jgi:hypothetical protein
MEGSEQECMVCKQPISTEFIFMHTPKVFRDEYVKKIVKLDMVRERALLKATQERMNARARNKILTSRIAALIVHLRRCRDDTEMLELLQKSVEERRKLNEDILEKSDEEISNVSTSFLCPMPICLGLVKNGRCSDCKKTICTKCRDECLEKHECNKEQLDNIQFLQRDTKPCPKCKVPIHKIDGCDQMFCTKCKTAFSWRTLNIERGIIHNPHYNEYITQLNREGIQLGVNDPRDEELDKALREMPKNKYIVANFIPRVLNDISTILPILRNDVHSDETIRQKKQNLRQIYLIQRKKNWEKAEANWNNQLRLMYKRRELKKDLIKIIEVFERKLKDVIIMGHADQDYITMFNNIGILIYDYLKKELIKNEKRHNLKNKTTITIDHGLQCKLITY